MTEPKPPEDCLDEVLDNWCQGSTFYRPAKQQLAALRADAEKWREHLKGTSDGE